MTTDDRGTGPEGAAGRERAAARRHLVLLLLGIGAVLVGSIAGVTGALGRILEPPFPLGLLLAAAAGILGVVVVLRAAARAGGAHEDARELIRAVHRRRTADRPRLTPWHRDATGGQRGRRPRWRHALTRTPCPG